MDRLSRACQDSLGDVPLAERHQGGPAHSEWLAPPHRLSLSVCLRLAWQLPGSHRTLASLALLLWGHAPTYGRRASSELPPGGESLSQSQLRQAQPLPPPLAPPLLLWLQPPAPILPPGEVVHGLRATEPCALSPPSIWSALSSRARPPAAAPLLPLHPLGVASIYLCQLCWHLSRPWGVREPPPQALRAALLLVLRAPGAGVGIVGALPDVHLSVQRLGDAVELLIVHVGKGPLHVLHEPVDGMP